MNLFEIKCNRFLFWFWAFSASFETISMNRILRYKCWFCSTASGLRNFQEYQPSAYAAIKINANDHWLHFSNYLLDSNVNAVFVRRRIFCLPRDTSTQQRQTYQVPKAVIVSPFSEIVWNFERWWYGGWANLHTNAIRLHSSHIMCNVVTTLNAGKHVNYIFVCASVSLCAMRMWWAASAICFNEKKTCLTTCVTERFSFSIPLRW